jgi:hypothetical protein
MRIPAMILTAMVTGAIQPAGGFSKSNSFLTKNLPYTINIKIILEFLTEKS